MHPRRTSRPRRQPQCDIHAVVGLPRGSSTPARQPDRSFRSIAISMAPAHRAHVTCSSIAAPADANRVAISARSRSFGVHSHARSASTTRPSSSVTHVARATSPWSAERAWRSRRERGGAAECTCAPGTSPPSAGLVRLWRIDARTQPSSSILMCSIATALAFASRSGSACELADPAAEQEIAQRDLALLVHTSSVRSFL